MTAPLIEGPRFPNMFLERMWYEGKEAYKDKKQHGFCSGIHFDEANKYWIAIPHETPIQSIPEVAMKKMKDVTGSVMPSGLAKSIPVAERTQVFLFGFAKAALEAEDWQTGLNALQVLTEGKLLEHPTLGPQLKQFMQAAQSALTSSLK